MIPARVIEGAMKETEVQHLQLTENLHRENMTIHDIVVSIEAVRAAGLTQQQVANRLNFSLSRVRIYLQVGADMRANKTLALFVDQGLLRITQFQAAAKLLTKAHRKLDDFTDDPVLQAKVLAQSEVLFNAMLERLMYKKRVTVKTISTEGAHLLSVAGLAKPCEY